MAGGDNPPRSCLIGALLAAQVCVGRGRRLGELWGGGLSRLNCFEGSGGDQKASGSSIAATQFL